MYKKTYAEKVGWYSDKLEFAQDYDLTIKLMEVGNLHVIKEFLTSIYQPNTSMSKSESLRKTVLEENIIISKKQIKSKNTGKKEISIYKIIIDIYLIKMSLISLKENFLKSLTNIIKIVFKNPIIIFKFNILKKFDEISKYR